MYEPRYSPTMQESFIDGVRFGALKADRYVRVGDPDIEPLHIHEYVEIFFNVSSDVSFLINNNLYPVKQGEAVVSRANELHVCIYNSSGEHSYFCLWIDAPAESPLLEFLKSKEGSPLFELDDRERMLAFLECIAEPKSRLEQNAAFLGLLAMFDRSGKDAGASKKLPEGLQRILDDLRESFAEIKGVAEIAEAHFVSTATLNRWFRKYIHSSPREYLESLKLSQAAKLLSSGESVTEACMRSGFSDCSHFIALFKKKFGETPLKYKNGKMKIEGGK